MTPGRQALVPSQGGAEEWKRTRLPVTVVGTEVAADADLVEGLVDTVVRDLFRIGLELQSIRSRVDPGVRVQVDTVTGELDHLIGTVRRTVVDILESRRPTR